MAQHWPPSSVVLHCWKQSDVWPNVSLPPSDTRWQARRHQRRPSFPWGKKPQGTTKSFPWGTKPRGLQEELHPLASAASLTPPHLPLGDETPRNNSLVSAETSAAPASLGGQNPKEQLAGKRGNIGRLSFPWGAKPRGQVQRRASLGGAKP